MCNVYCMVRVFGKKKIIFRICVCVRACVRVCQIVFVSIISG